MQQILVIPEFGVSTQEVAVLEWLKEVGDRVERGDALLHVETDKATVEVEATHEGILLEQLCQVGETLEVGRPYAAVGSPDEAVAPEEPAPGLDKSAMQPTATNAPAPLPPRSETPPVLEPDRHSDTNEQRAEDRQGDLDAPAPNASGTRPIRATPRARRLARDLGLDLLDIPGSGPDGRVRDTDVTAALAASEAAATESVPDVATTPASVSAPTDTSSVIESLSPVQKVAVRRLLEQHRETPQFHLEATAEADAVMDLLRAVNDGLEQRYSMTDVILRAAAKALIEVPRANVRWASGSREVLSTTHLGLAVAAGGDLLVPVLRDVAGKSLQAVRADRLAVARAARERTLSPSQQGGGSLTVSNLGMFKVDGVFPVLNPPEAMIIGVGRVRHPKGGDTAQVRLVVGADHRVLNGATVAEYLSRLVDLVERPVHALL